MLVFTRKPGDGIRIGENVELKVLSVSGGTVRLGVEAPNDVRIHRKEILLRLSDAASPSEVASASR